MLNLQHTTMQKLIQKYKNWLPHLATTKLSLQLLLLRYFQIDLVIYWLFIFELVIDISKIPKQHSSWAQLLLVY